MRIDKYLKVARIIKKRSIAKELADNGRIFVNGKTVKPAYEVEIGDKVKVIFGNRELNFEILQIKEHVKKEESFEMYQICQ